MNMQPKQIVAELSRYIIGQDAAKRAVAVALRNRYRRSCLPESIKDDITPKNIIMQGPTGVGKTEIARRLAKLVKAPFIKVEATKYTEVEVKARDIVEKKIIDALVADGKKKNSDDAEPVIRGALLADLKAGKLRNTKIDIKIVDNPKPMEIMPGMGAAIDLNEIFGGQFPKKTKTRTLTVAEATQILMVEESDKLIDNDSINAEAVRRAEQEGIVFIDEIDKIAAKGSGSGPDVSREGVQRDILPIIEGSTVMTKYGAIRTDYILFIASGAFHISKIEDLIPELQGRFPIRVELQSLTKKDFFNILIQPDNAITKQYTSLLAVDNIKLEFTDEAIDEISEIAFLENETSENIGARRLHTVMESLLEDISFNASGDHPEIVVTIDRKYVVEHLTQAIKKHDLKKYIL